MKITRDVSNPTVGRIPNSGKMASVTRKSRRPSPISRKNFKKPVFPLASKAGK